MEKRVLVSWSCRGCLGVEGYSLWLRVQAGQARTEEPEDIAGRGSVCRSKCTKGYTRYLYMEILIIWNSETQTESHPPVGNPPPQSFSGVRPNHWKQTRGPSTVIALPRFMHGPGVPQMALYNCILTLGAFWGLENRLFPEVRLPPRVWTAAVGRLGEWAGSSPQCPIRYKALGKSYNLYEPVSSSMNQGLLPISSEYSEKWAHVTETLCILFYVL